MFLHDNKHIISKEVYTKLMQANRGTMSRLRELHKHHFIDFYMYAHCEEDF